jgi:predicted GH43/DUF377 family glycosyl hydrolase
VTTRLSESLLLRPSDVAPSHAGWEIIGVLNPAVAVVGDDVVMLVRVAERPAEKRLGLTALPRWRSDSQVAVDWIEDVGVQPVDARVVAMKRTGNLRLTSVSHLQVLRQSKQDSGSWSTEGVLLPKAEYEEFGIEDPRITKIGNTFWITYVAVSKFGALTALLSSTDLVKFERHGIIFPCENKDVDLFPQAIAGEFFALHRPNPSSHFSPPSVWLARSPDLMHWGGHRPLLHGCQPWEGDRVGSGTPPILIDEGWLLLYHGSEVSQVDGRVGRYAAGGLLLDRHDPTHVIGRSSVPIMVPKAPFELNGFVPNVVFPTAMIDRGGTLQVFYGAADTCVAMAEFSKQEMLESMTPQAGTS